MSQTSNYPECMQALIEELSKMPGVGIRTAERLAFHILGSDEKSANRLSESILQVHSSIRYCKACFNLSVNELCTVCSDVGRDPNLLCVVEEPKDINVIEKAGVFKGVYHVLLGVLSPLDGVGPADIKIPELLARVKSGSFKEVIMATTSDTEGEATSIYLTKAMANYGVRLTRLAQGIPVGSDLEFTDRATLVRAIESRNEIRT